MLRLVPALRRLPLRRLTLATALGVLGACAGAPPLPDMSCPTVPTLARSAPPPGLSAVAAPRSSAIPNAPTSLGQAIDNVLAAKVLPRANAGIRVVELDTGATLYEHDPDRLLAPASNLKLFTAAGALGILGAESEIETTLSIADDQKTLFLKGCGDSLLRAEELGALALTAASALDTRKSYVLKVDLGCFDDLYWGKGWMWDDEPDPDAMYISPLSVNGNTVIVKVEPAENAGDKPKVSLIPRTRLVKIDNRARTVEERRHDELEVGRRPGDRDNLVLVKGPILRGAEPIERAVSVWAPEDIAVEIVRRTLQGQNIKIESQGGMRSPPRVTELARQTRRVGELVHHMLKTSSNLTAECLLKHIGYRAKKRAGSAEAGISAIKDFLADKGVGLGDVVWVDGSGLSRYNLIPAAALVRLLTVLHAEPALYAPLYASLPVAGVDGTLARRMKGTSAETNVHAKTGSMSGVSSLSGYATIAGGRQVAFALLFTGFAGSVQSVEQVEDEIVNAILASGS